MLNISLTIILKQIKQAIHRLLNSKALESDSILNEIFKKVTYIIKNDLA